MKDMKRLFKNEVAKRILLFFNENPCCIDTAKGISIWIGCDVMVVQKTLKALVKKGILINYKTPATDAYSYTNQRVIIKKIEEMVSRL